MDNNFEEQFTQKLRATPIQPVNNTPQNNTKLPLIISIILSAVVLVESIALIITLVNYFDTFSYEETEVVEEEDPTVNDFVFDDDGNLIAFNGTCKDSETGASFVLTTNNSYKEYDPSSNLINSGTYSIKRDSIVEYTTSTGEKKTLFYDGFILTDNTTIYDCEEPETESE